ncbi:hypothetical protein IF1G_00647 [Cordyceps javanica]|uniref:Uncharacterized protein n=1 Tax=Cordyceps javanica TaxID=43265 RepID=A0A545VG71_9HYPO|nr:hypothetical protein IF1G_00647 [Cordyceps javanica]
MAESVVARGGRDTKDGKLYWYVSYRSRAQSRSDATTQRRNNAETKDPRLRVPRSSMLWAGASSQCPPDAGRAKKPNCQAGQGCVVVDKGHDAWTALRRQVGIGGGASKSVALRDEGRTSRSASYLISYFGSLPGACRRMDCISGTTWSMRMGAGVGDGDQVRMHEGGSEADDVRILCVGSICCGVVLQTEPV